MFEEYGDRLLYLVIPPWQAPLALPANGVGPPPLSPPKEEIRIWIVSPWVLLGVVGSEVLSGNKNIYAG